MTLARTPYARLSPADIGQVDRELKKLEQMSAGLYVPKVLVAARSPYTVQGTDTMLLCDCTAGPITLTFPLAARVDGMTVQVVKSDTSANAVTLSGTFSGVASPTLTVQDSGFTVVAMNNAYHVTAFVPYPIATGESGVVSFVYPYGDVRRYGATGVAGTNARAAFAAADAAAVAGYGGNRVVRVPAGTHRIASNLTMASAVSFEGGIVKPDAAVTVTLNGTVITAIIGRIFDTSAGGTIVLKRGSVLRVLPQWWGAVGDGVTDDSTAIQSAATAAVGVGELHFPPSTYKTTVKISTSAAILVTGRGAVNAGTFGSRIENTLADYMFEVIPGGITLGGGGFRDLAIINGNTAAGGCIRGLNLQAPCAFRDLYLSGYRGLTLESNDFTMDVEDCAFLGIGHPTNGWGVYAGGHLNLISCDIVGFDHAVRHAGAGLKVAGGRFEVNRSAVVLGLDFNGNSSTTNGAAIAGCTMEANDRGVDIRSATAVAVDGVNILGTTSAPSGQAQFGVFIGGIGKISVRSTNVGGAYALAAIRVVSADVTFVDVLPANSLGTGQLWDVESPEQCAFINTNYGPKSDGVSISNMVTTLAARSLGAVDHLRGTIPGRNVRGYNVPVASAATFLDIVFNTGYSTGAAALNTATAVVDAGSTLAAGTYFYVATLVNEYGETATTSEKTVVVPSGDRVDLTFFGVAGNNWRRRVYRGTASGVYDGYFEAPIESSATLSDLGQAFTGRKMPPSVLPNMDGRESDTNYAITVAPQWNTAVWISNKATTGFRVNFATAPGSTTALDWHILR